MRRPLEGSYRTTFAIVMIALCPNTLVTTAWTGRDVDEGEPAL